MIGSTGKRNREVAQVLQEQGVKISHGWERAVSG